MGEYGADEVMLRDVPGVEDRVRGMLDEARIHLEDAIDTLREVAKLSSEHGGPYWLHGQLESYTIPWLGTFVESERQPGSIEGLLRALDEEA
jgi:hypothetical protein